MAPVWYHLTLQIPVFCHLYYFYTLTFVLPIMIKLCTKWYYSVIWGKCMQSVCLSHDFIHAENDIIVCLYALSNIRTLVVNKISNTDITIKI